MFPAYRKPSVTHSRQLSQYSIVHFSLHMIEPGSDLNSSIALEMCGNNCQLDATDGFFIEDLIAC